jgi:hypothetical protein
VRGGASASPIAVAEQACNQTFLPETESYFIQFIWLEPPELQSFATCLYLTAAEPKVGWRDRMFPRIAELAQPWLREVLGYAKELQGCLIKVRSLPECRMKMAVDRMQERLIAQDRATHNAPCDLAVMCLASYQANSGRVLPGQADEINAKNWHGGTNEAVISFRNPAAACTHNVLRCHHGLRR